MSKNILSEYLPIIWWGMELSDHKLSIVDCVMLSQTCKSVRKAIAPFIKTWKKNVLKPILSKINKQKPVDLHIGEERNVLDWALLTGNNVLIEKFGVNFVGPITQMLFVSLFYLCKGEMVNSVVTRERHIDRDIHDYSGFMTRTEGGKFVMKLLKNLDMLDYEELWDIASSCLGKGYYSWFRQTVKHVLKSFGIDYDFNEIVDPGTNPGFLDAVDFENIYLEHKKGMEYGLKKADESTIRTYIKNKINTFPALKKKYAKKFRTLKMNEVHSVSRYCGKAQLEESAKIIYKNKYEF